MNNQLLVANFGGGYASLATVGYTVYDRAAAEKQARTTTGVTEVGTATGIYMVNVGLGEAFDGVILWDTGGATPIYAVQETFSQLNAIQDETDNIRKIWNSLRNQGKMYEKMVEKVEDIKKEKTKDYESKFNEIVVLLEEVKNKPFPIPKDVVIPEVKIPDYANQFADMNYLIGSIIKQVSLIPTQNKDYSNELSGIVSHIQNVLTNIETSFNNVAQKVEDKFQKLNNDVSSKVGLTAKSDEMKSSMGSLLSEMDRLKKQLSSAQNKLELVDSNISRNMKPSKFLQDIYGILQSGQELRELVEEYQKKTKSLNLMGIS